MRLDDRPEPRLAPAQAAHGAGQRFIIQRDSGLVFHLHDICAATMTTRQPVFRFAPSPNGQLHLGHAYSALLNQKMAEEANGRLLLRIEDTDQTRCKPEFVQGVYEDLRWLGLTWEEPVRIQSEHFDDYENALEKLWQAGAIFPCFCSRRQVLAEAGTDVDPDGGPLYGGSCRCLSRDEATKRINAGTAHGWRLITEESDAAPWGDVMIAKRHVGSCYHIAVVADDALQGVTHVVRGKDMEAATPIHLLLQHQLGLPHPEYHHHDLILDEHGRKLSKSIRSKSIASLRAQGASASDIRKQLGFS